MTDFVIPSVQKSILGRTMLDLSDDMLTFEMICQMAAFNNVPCPSLNLGGPAEFRHQDQTLVLPKYCTNHQYLRVWLDLIASCRQLKIDSDGQAHKLIAAVRQGSLDDLVFKVSLGGPTPLQRPNFNVGPNGEQIFAKTQDGFETLPRPPVPLMLAGSTAQSEAPKPKKASKHSKKPLPSPIGFETLSRPALPLIFTPPFMVDSPMPQFELTKRKQASTRKQESKRKQESRPHSKNPPLERSSSPKRLPLILTPPFMVDSPMPQFELRTKRTQRKGSKTVSKTSKPVSKTLPVRKSARLAGKK